MSARIHLRNLAFNWGGHTATLLVMFFLSPYIVGKLDAVSYGIWSLLNVLTGYMGLFDLGVRASVGRYVALYIGKDDAKGVDETVRAGFAFFSLIGVFIFLAGILLGFLFPILFKNIGSDNYHMVRMLLPLMAINVWLSTVAAIYSSLLAAYDRFDIAQLIDIVVLIIRTFGTVFVLSSGWGLYGLVTIVICGNLCALLGNRIFAGRIHQNLKSFPLLFSKNRIKQLYSYGIPAFVTSSAVKIIGQSDLIIVGLFLSVSAVREYSIGAMLILYFSRNLSIISRTLFPAVQRAAAKNKIGDVLHLLNRQMQISFFVGLIGFIGFVFYSKPFVYLWMFQDGFDDNSVTVSANIMSILAISSIPLIYTRPINNVLSAIGFIKFTAKISIVEACFNVVFSFFFILVLNFGIYGVALGTLSARTISALCSPWFLFIRIGNFKKFLFELFFPGVLSSVLLSFFCYLLLKKYYPADWLEFFTHIFVVSIFWAAVAYFFFFKFGKALFMVFSDNKVLKK